MLAPAAGVAAPTAIGTCADELALAHDVAQEREREHERVCFPPHESHGLFCGVFLSLFIGVYTISRSDFPATPAHAATCPPKARGRFFKRAWRRTWSPSRERSTSLVLTPLQTCNQQLAMMKRKHANATNLFTSWSKHARDYNQQITP